jgi:NAD(P)-dependent dehydrogenase (short-subunit alcohol dehydrogenase family)
MPSLKGKVILITSGNNGIGKQSALEFTKHEPLEVWITSRDTQKGQAAVDDIKLAAPGAPIRMLELDLSSFTSIKAATKHFFASTSRLDILMLNAGTFGGPPSLTEDGYELRFGTNHMGHALLTKLLTPMLLKTASGKPKSDVRVVCLSSAGHAWAPPGGILFDTLKSPDKLEPTQAYSMSKLANLLFAKEMAKEFSELVTVAVNPGEVKTDLFEPNGAGRKLWALRTFLVPLIAGSVEDGAKNQLWAATADGVQSGELYYPVGVTGKTAPVGLDEKLAKKLWDWTNKELEEHSI